MVQNFLRMEIFGLTLNSNLELWTVTAIIGTGLVVNNAEPNMMANFKAS